MRKQWHWIGIIGLLLTACTTTETTQTTPAPAYNGPVVEIPGVEPRYEPYNPNTNQDYEVNGKTYHIVKNPQNFSETGLASWYGAEQRGNTTATGEPFDATALTAAHPTLPLPSYVRVTNLSNGRQVVVRVNDRGPYTPGRIIDLSQAAAERLNISNNTTVRVDFIQVAPDGTLSGPGTVGTVVAKQSFALPPRPNLSSGAAVTSPMPVDDTRVGTTTMPIANPPSTTMPANDTRLETTTATTQQPGQPAAGAGSGGFLVAPSALPAGVLESDHAATASSPSPATGSAYNATHGAATPPAVASATVAPRAAAASGRYVVQVGALADRQRAIRWQKSLSQRFGVPGRVTSNGNLYRVQLGPFPNRQQAAGLQQRLSSEGRQQSFITTATGM
ncbi:endolytic peptidoglycan transglycosylase RlpA [Martelella alba]|uniref:Endolytic peptidoglycan transglycosylase RlpA n=1 Tax=Martelella alba TaxID=2590451 RepID=A0ABY2SJ43_9HYPH|nr:endolytic peptidoglycan transglycosylase RlpA [Martelella alba]TKI05484.1 endolytic peptidoglycan transglycosylase RlpA [Martelella alba]